MVACRRAARLAEGAVNRNAGSGELVRLSGFCIEEVGKRL